MGGPTVMRSNFPIHTCWEWSGGEDGEEVATECACHYPTDHPWPPHGGESGRRLIGLASDDACTSCWGTGDDVSTQDDCEPPCGVAKGCDACGGSGVRHSS